MNWSTSCIDWEERIIKSQSLIPFSPLFPEEAARALSVFKQLRIVDIQGQPTMGEACEQWVFDFVAAIFGAYDSENGRRLITEFFLLIAKKNTKSTIASGIMLTAIIINWRYNAEALILAPTMEVANNSFLPARGMIKIDEELEALLHVQDHLRMITHREKGATLKIVAADNETVSGKKASYVLLDELWLFGKKANAENMIREACGGLASRPEGFKVSLSTQSDEPPAGIFKQDLAYARDVRDGIIVDPCLLPVIYEFPQKMLKNEEHKKNENFYITNPNLGISVDVPYLEREYKKAENAGEESMRGFLAKHLNVEIGLAMRSDRWPGADFWQAQNRGVTLEEILERSDVITAGGDGGGLDDLLGLCILGRDRDDNDLWRAWFRAWCHPIALERRKSEISKYRDFEKDGDLVIVDRVGEDVDQFCEIIQKCEDAGLLERIGVDPSGIAEVVTKLKLMGFEDDRIVGVAQGWRLTSSIKDTERKVAAGELIHSGANLMNWCVSNARKEPKGNAILITKQASGTGKIDPLMALFMAVALMVLNPEARGGVNFYDRHSLIVS